jgi:hypothetical protein
MSGDGREGVSFRPSPGGQFSAVVDTRHGEELKGDRIGTDSEPRSLRIEPNGERLGTEWGLGPPTIEQTTEDVTAIHRLAASRLRGRRLCRHRRPARTPSGDPREGRRHGPRREPNERQDGPEPGHLTRRRARS